MTINSISSNINLNNISCNKKILNNCIYIKNISTIVLIVFLVLIQPCFSKTHNIKINEDIHNEKISFQSCNQGIIKDWGFPLLAESNPNSPWSVTNSSDFVLSFVRELEEGFQDRSITGFFAARLQMANEFQNNFKFYFNQTVYFPNVTSTKDGVFISFQFDSPQMNTKITIFIDDMKVYQISPTSTQYERSTQMFYVPLYYLDGVHNLSMSLEFTSFGANSIYIEDFKALRMPLQNGDYPSLPERDEKGKPIFAKMFLNEKGAGGSHNYYVGLNGSDLTGDGSINFPWASIQQAIIFASHSNSVINLYPGYFCGLGNSYIDTLSKGIMITSIDKKNISTITGLGQLDIISYVSLFVHQLQLDNLKITEPNVYETGSAILISGLTTLIVTNCQFNQLSNNSITLNYLSEVVFINSTFKNYNDYAIYATGLLGSEELTIDNCIFTGMSSLFLLNLQDVVIRNTTMPGNQDMDVVSPTCGFSINMVGTVKVYDCHISLALCAVQTNITLDRVRISNPYADSSTIVLTQNADLTVTNSYFGTFNSMNTILAFHGNVNITGSIFNYTTSQITVMVESCTLEISNCQFIDESHPIAIDTAPSTIQNSIFTNCKSQFLSATQSHVTMLNNSLLFYEGVTNNLVNSNIFVTNNSYSNSKITNPIFTLYNTAFYDYNSRVVNCESTYLDLRTNSALYANFTTLISNYASAFIVSDTSIVSADHIHCESNDNSQFMENLGSIFYCTDTSKTVVTNSKFIKNRSQIGGVAALSLQAIIILQDSLFLENSAVQSGGLVFTTSVQPSNFFRINATQNRAREGSIIYYSQAAPLIENCTLVNNTQKFGSEVALGAAQFMVSFGGPSISSAIDSGSSGYSFYIQLQDTNGNNITNKFCKSICNAYLSLAGQFLKSSEITYNGTALFTNITLIGTIGSQPDLVISSNEASISEFSIEIQFKNCSPGHQPSQNGQLCVPCQAGSYGTNGLTCSVCPANVICNGPDYLPATGYWIDDALDNLVAYPCPEGLCGEGGNCTQDYTGPLCAACEPGYYNCGSGCKKTDGPNPTIIILKILVFFILVLFQQLSDDSSGLVTIALYFIQNLVVISNGIKFSIISAFSGSSSSHTGTSSSIISFINDCVAPISFFTNHYIILMQPLFLFIVLAIIISIELIFRRTGIIYKVPVLKNVVSSNDSEFRNRQFSAFIKICMNSYGPLITEILLILFCYDVGSFLLLNANPGIQCKGHDYETAKHITWGLLSVVILFPFSILFLLLAYRRRMAEKDVVRKLGVFFLKYKPNFYFWDVVLLFKRLTIVTLSLLPTSAPQRSIALVALSFASLFLQLKYQPFVQRIDNHLETISLTLLFVCCIYLDNALWESTEQWILLISLLVFIGAALKLQFQYYLNQIKKIITPILEKIRACRSDSKTGGRSRSYSQNHGANDTTFDYDAEEDDDYDENQKLIAANKDHIGKVDRRNNGNSNMSLSFRLSNNNNIQNEEDVSPDRSFTTTDNYDSFSDYGSMTYEKIPLSTRKNSNIDK